MVAVEASGLRFEAEKSEFEVWVMFSLLCFTLFYCLNCLNVIPLGATVETCGIH